MQRFFAFGYNKSGTTFLQQLLDGHPRVNCPPEHSLRIVQKYLKEFAKQYRTVIQSIDDRTGRQGLRYDERQVVVQALVGVVDALMRCGAGPATTHIGLNDNTFENSLPIYARIFADAKFVAIVRDPREIAVSLYHHKMRHEEAFRARDPRISVVASAVGKKWPEHIDALQKYRRSPDLGPRLTVVRYEDLIGAESHAALTAVFDHLGVEAGADEIAGILARNDFAARRAQTGDDDPFLRAGRPDSWRDELSGDDVRAIEAAAGPQMAAFGYAPIDARKSAAAMATGAAVAG